MFKITSHIYKYSCISSQVSMPSLCLDSCVLSDQCYGFSTVRFIYTMCCGKLCRYLGIIEQMYPIYF